MKQYYIEDNEPIPAIIKAEQQPEGYSLLTDQAKILELTKIDYNKKQFDGSDFYNGFRSSLYLEIVSGNITPPEAFAVEAHLKDIADNLVSGNWLTAQALSQAKALSGIYDQALKDDIQAGIDNYISTNY